MSIKTHDAQSMLPTNRISEGNIVMNKESEVSTARKADTLVVPGTEGQVARRILEAINAQTVQITKLDRQPKTSPVAALIEAWEARPRAIVTIKSRVQRKKAETLTALTNGVSSIVEAVSLAPDQSGGISTDNYVPLPAWKATTDVKAYSHGWRIELCDIMSGMKSLKFNILGDVFIGRGPDADIDLEPYEALSQAVSRRHAMLRPTENHLYLIDMESTNGTFFNSVPLSRSATHAIEDGDIVALGKLSFVIRIVDAPQGKHVAQGISTGAYTPIFE